MVGGSDSPTYSTLLRSEWFANEMRIAYVYDVVYPFVKGGAQKRIWEMSRRLVAKGHDVTILGMKYWEGPQIVYREGVRLWGICPVKELFVNGRRSIGEALYVGWMALPALQKETYDIIDCQNFPYFPCFSAKMASVLKGSPLLITWHEVWGDYWGQYLGRRGILGKIVERMAARLARNNLVGTRHNMERLHRLGARSDRIALIPMGGISFSDIQRIPPASEASDIVFVGRLVRTKGVDTLLEAIHYLKMNGTRATLSIIGDGTDRNNLESLSQKLEIQDEVRFHGRLQDDSLVMSMMKYAKVFVYPAAPEGGWSISVIEANACGLPAVSVRSGALGNNEVVIDGYNGLLAEQQSAEALGAKIRLVLQQESLRTELRRNALAFAQEQDWGILAGRIEEYYSQAVCHAS